RGRAMTGFVSSPATVPAPADEPVLAHDGAFFPGIKASAVRALAQMPATVTEFRLIEAAYSAMLTVSVALEDWAALQIAAGFATIAAVSPATIGGPPPLVRLYDRAI